MSNTTHEAPERIWLQLGAGDEGTHTWSDHQVGWADHQVGWDDEGEYEYEPEYVRADLVQAAVAAALREAADAVEDYCSEAPDLAGHGHSGAIRGVITALITPDAQAALEVEDFGKSRPAAMAFYVGDTLLAVQSLKKFGVLSVQVGDTITIAPPDKEEDQ